MGLFAGLRKIREHERGQLPFLKSVADFDIVVEIGYHEERGRPIGLKQLFLQDICSKATVRRRLAKLIEGGVVIRNSLEEDRRVSILLISPGTLKLFRKFTGVISDVAEMHFN